MKYEDDRVLHRLRHIGAPHEIHHFLRGHGIAVDGRKGVLAFQKDVAEHLLQGIVIGIGDIYQGIIKIIPPAHRVIQRDHGDDGLGQGYRDPEKLSEPGAAVDLRGLIQAFRDGGLIIGPGHHHVVYGKASYYDQGVRLIQKPQIPHHQVGGKQSAGKIHDDHKIGGDEPPAPQILFAQGVGRGNGQHQAHQCSEYRVGDAVAKAHPDLLVLKDLSVAVQGKSLRPEHHISRNHVVGL